MNEGLLVLHGFLGAALVAHALQKLLQFRVAGTAAYLAGLGLRAGPLLALAVIGNELVGGLLLGLGLLRHSGRCSSPRRCSSRRAPTTAARVGGSPAPAAST